MTGVIYADVLFILNTYITYALLMLTAFFLGISAKRSRLLIASLLGGLSSFAVLLEQASNIFLGILRAILCLLFVVISFSYKGKRQLVRQITTFLVVNFLFAGLIFALWYFVNPSAVYYNTGVVYLDIDALTLIVITAVCYFVLKIFNSILGLKNPKNTLYDVWLYILDDEIFLKGFLDTGNSLDDPFTGAPIIVVSREALTKYFPFDEDLSSIIETSPLKIRYLPCNTVSGSRLLPIFKAGKVRIKGISSDFTCRGVMIAVSDENIKNGEFQALLPTGIFQNNYSDKGEDYDETQRLHMESNI